jgi:adenosylmethionine-8-amino-7-oxononanoate aminotransferase
MDHYSVDPDMITFAKGISSSYVPLGGVIVSDAVHELFNTGVGFVHGFTSGGNALACAAGCAVIEAIREDGLLEAVREREAQLFSYRDRLLAHPNVADVRGWGLFMVLELVKPGPDGKRNYFAPEDQAELKFQTAMLRNGVAMYSTLYGPNRRPVMQRGLPMWIAPAFTITEAEMTEMMDRIDRALHQWEQMMVTP